MAKRNRATEAEQQRRVDTLMTLSARGYSTMQLVRAACQQWGVSERQAMRYVSAAKEQESKLAQQPLDTRVGHLLSQFNFIYQQAIQMEDYELARRVTADRVHLLMQQAKGHMNDAGQSSKPNLVEPDELEALVRSLEKTGKAG